MGGRSTPHGQQLECTRLAEKSARRASKSKGLTDNGFAVSENSAEASVHRFTFLKPALHPSATHRTGLP